MRGKVTRLVATKTQVTIDIDCRKVTSPAKKKRKMNMRPLAITTAMMARKMGPIPM